MKSLRECDASFGGKAANLAKLVAAGLPVPEGFAISDANEDVVAYAAALAASTFAVRSSADLEDRATGAAPGVFESTTRVPLADVPAAVQAVWSSGTLPIAVEYAHLAGQDAPRVSVIVQRFVEGERVIVYTRPPGHATTDEVWVQRDLSLAKLRRDAPGLVQLAIRSEAAIGATLGADVELVVDGDTAWVVQARPIVHPRPARTATPPPEIVLAPLRDGRAWTWDVAHNPDPLSTAQAGLVELVDRAGVSRYALRVVAGFLYTATREAPPPARSPEDLERACLDAIAPAPLAEALERYVRFYAAWSELSAVIAAMPRSADDARPSAVHSQLLACARGELSRDELLSRIGEFSPAWDVAVPTFAERPRLVDDALARLTGLALPSPLRPETRDQRPTTTLDWSERDDDLFAQAQSMVRRAIQNRAGEIGIDPDDAFWLSLDELAAGHLDRDAAHRKAAGARAAATRAAAWSMPLVIGAEGTSPHDAARRAASHTLSGHGTGGRARGRVVRFASLGDAVLVGRGDVIVARAITPALAVFAPGCAAIVSETGGPLDHGAAMARELGIPCVVGCVGAFAQLLDDTLVLVDADRGIIEIV